MLEDIFVLVYLLGFLLNPSLLMALVIMLNDYFSCEDDKKSKYSGLIKKHLIMLAVSLVICLLSVFAEYAEYRSVDELWEYLYWVFLFTVLFFLPVAVLVCLIKNIVRYIKAVRNNSPDSKNRVLIPFIILIAMIPACIALIIVFSSEMTFM